MASTSIKEDAHAAETLLQKENMEKFLDEKGMQNSLNAEPPKEPLNVGKQDNYEFEDIIEDLGSFGHWQRVIFFLISAADIFGGMAMLLPVFIGAEPNWRCSQFEGGNSTYYDKSLNGSDVTFLKTCERNGSKCIEYQFMDDFTSIISQWDLVCKYDYLSDLISSTQMGGVFLGAGLFGQLSDTFGRKRMYYLSFSIEIGAGLLSAVSVSWQMYAVCRFFVGAGFGAYMVVNCVYPLEFVGRRWRMLCGTIGFWAFGIIVLAGVAYLLRDWRYLTAATTGSGFLYFITWIWIPESPRWLVQKRRFKEAQEILAVIARKNNKPMPPQALLEKFAEEDEIERGKLKSYTYLDLFRRWRYAKLTIIMALGWFAVFLAYYEISFNLKNFSGDRYVNMLLGGTVDLSAMMIVLLLLNNIGRKTSLCLFLLSDVIALVSIIIIIAIGKDESLPKVILGLALVGKAMALAGTYGVQILSAELFPTVIRNVGLGSGAIAGRLGGMLAPLLVYLGRISKLAPYIICSALAAVTILPILLLPETNRMALEDTYHQRKVVKAPKGQQIGQNGVTESSFPDLENTDFTKL